MGNEPTKTNENIYFKCRKEAAICNPKLYSRESAADLLGVSVSSLSDYELGNTKVVPVDKVNLMADLYNAPQLRTLYCKHDCPIGCFISVGTEILGIETIVLKMLNHLETGKINDVKKQLLEVAVSGDIKNASGLDNILKYLESLAESISELRLLCEKTKTAVKDL